MRSLNRWLFLLIITSFLLTMGFKCEKGKDFAEFRPKYEFSEKITLSPYRKKYTINDTIEVQFQTTDKRLFDKVTNRMISTDTTFLQVGFFYYSRYPRTDKGEFFCDIKVDNAIDMSFTILYDDYNVLNFKTDCSNNRYFFKIGFVPKKSGVYSIEPHISVADCPNKLGSQSSISNFVFDLADCNKDVWFSIPPGSRGGELGYTDARIDKKEIFVFRVE
jgi:hypothetical protein